MNKLVYAKHPPYENGHLALVADEMRHAGAPTIRVIERDGAYYALEGSHRLYLCAQQGVAPKLVVVEPELGEELDAFWNRVAPDLPRYEFGTVYRFDLKDFNDVV